MADGLVRRACLYDASGRKGEIVRVIYHASIVQSAVARPHCSRLSASPVVTAKPLAPLAAIHQLVAQTPRALRPQWHSQIDIVEAQSAPSITKHIV